MKQFETKETLFAIDEDEYQNDQINIRDVLEKYLYYWKWIALGIVCALILAYFILESTSNLYLAETTIIINDNESGGSSELSAFQDLSLFGNMKTPMENQIAKLKSLTLMDKVVEKLNLNVSYHIPFEKANSEIYIGDVPFKINFFIPDSIFSKMNTSFIISATSLTKFELSNLEGKVLHTLEFGKNFKTIWGDVNIIPLSKSQNISIEVRIRPKVDIIKKYQKNIIIREPSNLQSSLLHLSLVDPVRQKSKDILNTIVDQYNNDGIAYRSAITENTDKFINKRIIDISDELNIVDLDVEEFKTKNRLTDISYEAEMVLQSNTEVEKQIIDLQSQLKLIDYVQGSLKQNKDELLPTNLGLEDQSMKSNAFIYNQLLLEKQKLLKNSSEKNPTVINLTEQLSSLRFGINQNLNNLRSTLEISLNDAKRQANKIDSKRFQAPKQEREIQDILRKRQIIESLYLYLLEKKEENAIKQGVTYPNAQIIDRAYGSNVPVAPSKFKTFLIFGSIGAAIPIFIVFFFTLIDNKIHSIEDVEKYISAPFLGDIPKINMKKRGGLIKSQDNDNLAESFRIIRTNLNYMLSDKKTQGKIIFITSTIAGEGKTITSLNLASALAATNRKVIVIGADLRKPKISKYLNLKKGKGLTHYLVDDSINIEEIISHDKEYNFDIINSWEIPPNPSDLLSNGRFDLVLEYVKDQYEYVLVDTAPIGLVTDTMMLQHNSDLILYIVRANKIDKRLLKTTQKMYENNRLGKMAIILNGANFKKKGYGYGYGNS